MIEPLMNDKREENLSPLDWVNEQYRDPIGVNTIDQAIKYDWIGHPTSGLLVS